MANTIRLKRGTTEPTAGVLVTGELAIDTTNGDTYTKLDDGSVTKIQSKASNLNLSVRNETGSTIPAGSAVYINGASSNKPTITLAQANTEMASSKTLGLTATSISHNSNGEVVAFGLLGKLNTLSYAAGAALWLSPTVAGGLTTTKPTAPNHAVFIGNVSRSHATQGQIEVRVANGYEIGELHDVSISSTPANKSVIAYDTATSLWTDTTLNNNLIATTVSVVTADYTPANGEQNTIRKFSSVGAITHTVTLPDNTQSPIPVGSQFVFINEDGYPTSFQAGGTATLNSRGSLLSMNGLYSVVTAIKTDADVWVITGDLI